MNRSSIFHVISNSYKTGKDSSICLVHINSHYNRWCSPLHWDVHSSNLAPRSGTHLFPRHVHHALMGAVTVVASVLVGWTSRGFVQSSSRWWASRCTNKGDLQWCERVCWLQLVFSNQIKTANDNLQGQSKQFPVTTVPVFIVQSSSSKKKAATDIFWCLQWNRLITYHCTTKIQAKVKKTSSSRIWLGHTTW